MRNDKTAPLFEVERALPPTPQKIGQTVVLHFDGGTPCNIPRLGYGKGYGSYKFSAGPVVRVSHGVHCSANTAEILTLCVALEAYRLSTWPTANLAVHVEGDSQIALKWLCVAAGLPVRGKTKVSKGSSLEFQASIERLKQAVKPFSITCAWRGRMQSRHSDTDNEHDRTSRRPFQAQERLSSVYQKAQD